MHIFTNKDTGRVLKLVTSTISRLSGKNSVHFCTFKGLKMKLENSERKISW